ncbi:MAG: hypothetical protein F6K20_33025, partial [Moorea sp. SIO2C4]|nr:hypothetical protein [Moorena sp. SIO2C4]
GADGDWNPSNFDDAEYEDALSRYENAATLEDATVASQELQRMLSDWTS